MFADDASRRALGSLSPGDEDVFRRVVSTACYLRTRNGGDLSPEWLSRRVSRTPPGKTAALAALPALIDRMVEEGALAVVGPTATRPRPGVCHRKRPVARGEEGAVAARFRARAGARLGKDLPVEAQEGLAELIRRHRQCERPLSTVLGTLEVAGRARGVREAVALGWVRVGEGGASIPDLRLFAHMSDGAVRAFEVGAENLAVEFLEDGVRVRVDLSGVRPSARLEAATKIYPGAALHAPYAPHRRSRHDWDAALAWAGAGGVEGKARRRLIDGLAAVVEHGRRRGREAVASGLFRRALDPEIGRLASRVGVDSLSIRDLAFFSPASARSRRYRRQAVEAYPVFARAFLRRADLARVIDAGESLHQALVEATGLSAAMVRRLGRLHWQRTGRRFAGALCEIPSGGSTAAARLLAMVPLERLPVSRADWRGFNRLLAFSEGLWAHDADLHRRGMPGLAKRACRDWPAFEGRWQWVQDMRRDVLDRLFTALVQHPALGRRAGHPEGGEQYAIASALDRLAVHGEGAKLAELIERARFWHERAQDLACRMGQVSRAGATGEPEPEPEKRWPALDADYRGPGGGSIRWLTDAGALAAETAEMHHCVWSYTGSCLFSGSHIGAVSGGEGGRSTVEFRLERESREGGWRLRAVQHYGRHDRRAPADCARVVRAFVEERGAAIDAEGLEAARAERERHRALFDRQAGCAFDPSSDEQCSAVVEIYRPFLAPPFNRADRDALAEAVRAELRRSIPDTAPPTGTTEDGASASAEALDESPPRGEKPNPVLAFGRRLLRRAARAVGFLD